MNGGASPNDRNHGETENKRTSHNPYSVLINAGLEEQMEAFGYMRSSLRNALMWVGVVLTLGMMRLVLHWYPHWRLYLTHTRCSLHEADTVLVVENYQGKFKSYYVEDVTILLATDVSLPDLVKQDGEKICNDYEYQEMKHVDSVQYAGKLDLRLHLSNDTYRDVEMMRGIRLKKLFYLWDTTSASFLRLAGLEQGYKSVDFHASTGLSQRQQHLRQVVYGHNEIIVPMQSIANMVIMELLDPFYFFQAFSLLLWFIEGYIYYPIAIIIMTTFGVSSYVIQTRKSQRLLHDTVHTTGTATVCRGEDKFEEIPFNQLVPGDVIVIPEQGCQMHCDAMLLNGQCIMNESMLTGESVPVSKSPLPRYHQVNTTPHTLFCGTSVIQARSQNKTHIKAVVLRTGYLTTKGNLVRSILYPPPADFKFERDSYKFIGILAVIAVLGLIYTVFDKFSRGISAGDLIIKALDLLTICIPPALPAAMTVGKIFAQNRLEKARIYCINSRIINISGALNCMCFDKTGTLTEDGLDFYCAVPVEEATFHHQQQDPPQTMKRMPLLKAMAVCHSLTNINGKLSGDPLDMKMFESTRWTIEEPAIENASSFDTHVQSLVRETLVKPRYQQSSHHEEGYEEEMEQVIIEENVSDCVDDDDSMKTVIGLYHQFTFDSTLQRMSIVTQEQGSAQFVLYCKGSPEMIMSLSKPETVPKNIFDVLQGYTRKGYRVIALGQRVLSETTYTEIQGKSRTNYEIGLEFLGIIVMENRVKPQTYSVIETLKEAEFKVVMITGDNMETAISVARECGIVSPLENVINVSAVPRLDDTPAQLFYKSVVTSRSNSPTVPESSKNVGIVNASFDEDNGDNVNSEKNSNNLTNSNTNLDVDYKFAMTGTTWKIIRESFPDLLPRLVTRGAIFARMSSEQKQQLVLQLIDVGYIVGMCGDGANDCGALKAANVGISLSEAESSVASPFTSKESNISCVPKVIREGRAALTTAFGIFKFMVLYSLVEFLSVFMLYSIDSNLTDIEFLFIDIFLVLPLAITFGRTEAYTGNLVKDTPLYTLMSSLPLMSIGFQVLIMTAAQICSYFVVQLYPWFVPFEYSTEGVYSCYENYAVFGVSMGQYLIMSIVFSKGAPYRKPIYTNYVMLSLLVITGAVITYIAVYPAQWTQNMFELVIPPTYGFRLAIVGFWLINFCVSYFVEDFIVDYVMAKKLLPKLNKLPANKHEIAESEMLQDSDWPVIS